MLAPSLSVPPRFCVTDARSEPARSMSVSVDRRCSSSTPAARADRRSRIWSTACERLDAAFAPVAPTARRALPRSSISRTSDAASGACHVSPHTVAPLRASWRSASPPVCADSAPDSSRRSRIVSLYTSRYDSSSAKRASVALRMHSKSDSIARTITPAPPAVEPTIVCVFPEPVAPYASTVALRPLTTSSISGRVVTRKTASWPASASKT